MFDEIVSLENQFAAWGEFLRGKRSKPDVRVFARNLADEIWRLHCDLVTHKYQHGPYRRFSICDPKPRVIHKASVRDRLLHHAVHRVLYPYFDRRFIADSYSCRIGKGTHAAMNRFRNLAYRESRNFTRTAWVLKCDVRKFFASINHDMLAAILSRHLHDNDAQRLLNIIIRSFSADEDGKGLPLGNLTSQLLANLYLNDLDQFVKHRLKARSYIRYADDFLIVSSDRDELLSQLKSINFFLCERLKLHLHIDKVSIATLASGIDFLGWVHFPNYRVLRTVTRTRMVRQLVNKPGNDRLSSYLGLLKHGNSYKIRQDIKSLAWLFGSNSSWLT